MSDDAPKNAQIVLQKSTTELIPKKEIVFTSQTTVGCDPGTRAEVAVYQNHQSGIKMGGYAGTSYSRSGPSFSVGIRFTN